MRNTCRVNNEQVTGQIIKASLRLHSILGPGLSEAHTEFLLTNSQRGVQCSQGSVDRATVW
jgi:hypothetical protein